MHRHTIGRRYVNPVGSGAGTGGGRGDERGAEPEQPDWQARRTQASTRCVHAAALPPEAAEVECGARRLPFRRRSRFPLKSSAANGLYPAGPGRCGRPLSAEVERGKRRLLSPDSDEVECGPPTVRPHLSRAPAPAASLAGVEAAAPARPKPQAPPVVQVMAPLGVYSSQGRVYKEQKAQDQPPCALFPPPGATEEACRALPAAAGGQSPPGAATRSSSRSANP